MKNWLPVVLIVGLFVLMRRGAGGAIGMNGDASGGLFAPRSSSSPISSLIGGLGARQNSAQQPPRSTGFSVGGGGGSSGGTGGTGGLLKSIAATVANLFRGGSGESDAETQTQRNAFDAPYQPFSNDYEMQVASDYGYSPQYGGVDYSTGIDYEAQVAAEYGYYAGGVDFSSAGSDATWGGISDYAFGGGGW